MTNSFERFGITNLSPSSLNLWRASPGLFALRYVGKIKDAGDPAWWRGHAVEDGFAAALRSDRNCLTVAYRSFELNAQGEASEEVEAERNLIAPMLDEAMSWTPPGPLLATQIKVEHWLDDVPVPVIGYVDFAFDGADVDLKTTKACPSTPRPDHVRQVSLYRAARGRDGGLLYVTTKRHAYFNVDDDMVERALSDMQADAISLLHFLTNMKTKGDVLRALPVDWDDYRAPKIRVPLEEVLLAG
jgi:PD-(D/E)XK nuclease superfamily